MLLLRYALFLLSGLVPLLAAGQTTPPALFCGRIQQPADGDSIRSLRVNCFMMTQMRPEKKEAKVASDGSFRVELPIDRCQEVMLYVSTQDFPILLCPGDSLFLNLDAAVLTKEGETALLYFSGDRAEVNQQLAGFNAERLRRFPDEDPAPGAAPETCRDQLLCDARQQLLFLDEFRRQHPLNDTVDDWARQTIGLKPFRGLFTFLLREQSRQNDPDLVSRWVGTPVFDFLDSLRRQFPRHAISIAYHQFITSQFNYLNFLGTKRYIPGITAMNEEQQKEAVYIYNDSIYLFVLHEIHNRPPDFFRDAALTLFCGNFLEFPAAAPVVSPRHFDAIRDGQWRAQVQARYNLVRSENVVLPDPNALIPIPDTVVDVITWTGRQFPGKVVVIDFWATWCGSCLYTIDNHYPAFVQEFDPEKVIFVFAGVGSERQFLLKKISRFPLPARHILPNKRQEEFLQKTYEIRSLPRIVVLTPEGQIITDNAPGPEYGLAEVIRTAEGIR